MWPTADLDHCAVWKCWRLSCFQGQFLSWCKVILLSNSPPEAINLIKGMLFAFPDDLEENRRKQESFIIQVEDSVLVWAQNKLFHSWESFGSPGIGNQCKQALRENLDRKEQSKMFLMIIFYSKLSKWLQGKTGRTFQPLLQFDLCSYFPSLEKDTGLTLLWEHLRVCWEGKRIGHRQDVEQGPCVTVIAGVGVIPPICSLQFIKWMERMGIQPQEPTVTPDWGGIKLLFVLWPQPGGWGTLLETPPLLQEQGWGEHQGGMGVNHLPLGL